ncbi:MAG: hypothetical protein ACI8WB_006260, partial [Phenylobacterium sp.]
EVEKSIVAVYFPLLNQLHCDFGHRLPKRSIPADDE